MRNNYYTLFYWLMDSIKSKTRAKNFSDEEIMGIVDSLIEENKSRLFGPFSATLTLED